jgi:SAM-dependent methyltransferase
MPSAQFVHSQIAYSDLLDSLIRPGTRWLDIGCGHTILPDWIRDSIFLQKKLIGRCEIAHGCDPSDDRPHKAGLQKYVGDCETLPYPDGHFNLVTANMVVEHIADRAAFMAEIHRVLAVGGVFVLHTPNLFYPPILMASLMPKRLIRVAAYFLDGRDRKDIYPTHYQMNTRGALSGLRGFRVVELRSVETAPLLHKLPVVNGVESLLIRATRHARLQYFRSNWLGILEKIPETNAVRADDSQGMIEAETMASS